MKTMETSEKEYAGSNVELMHKSFYDTYYNVYKEMDEEEFISLIKKAQAGDLDARNKLWINNLSIIKKIAYKYKDINVIADIDDLIQEGALGVYQSIMLFDTNMNYKFSTYLYAAIRSFILRYLQKNSVLTTPAYIQAGIWNYKKIKTTHPEYNDQDIYQHMREMKSFRGLTFNNFINIKIQAELNVLSLYSARTNGDGDEDEDGILLDTIADPKTIEESSLEDDAINYMIWNNVLNCTDVLSPKEKDVLFKKIGYDESHAMTLEEIASVYGCTREYIRQIELRARMKIAPALKKIRLEYGLSPYEPKVQKELDKRRRAISSIDETI